MSYNNDDDVAIDAGTSLCDGPSMIQMFAIESYGATYDGISVLDGAHGLNVVFADPHPNAWMTFSSIPPARKTRLLLTEFFYNRLYEGG